MLEHVLDYSKTLVRKVTGEGDIAIDCTMGNGHDTLFLAKLVGPKGKVYSFDIQAQALSNTRQLLQTEKIEHVELLLTGHEKLLDYIPKSEWGKISSAMFNLGYLPKGDKSIITTGETTIQALKALLQILKPRGIIVLVIYSGHPGGTEEMLAVMDYVKALDQKQVQVLQYRFINQTNHAPFIIALEKIK